MTTTRGPNVGVAKNSRIAKRYTIPASVKEAMKYGPPRSPKLREQIVSATHNVVPRMYTLHAGVIFVITISILPYPFLTVPPQAPTPAPAPYKALISHAFVTPVQFDRFLTFFPRHNLGHGEDQ